MKYIFPSLVLISTVLLCVFIGCKTSETPLPVYDRPVYEIRVRDSNTIQTNFIGRFETAKIRLLCLKHSREFMADGDANMAIRAVNAAREKGLSIQDVGNHFIDRNGEMRVAFWEYGQDLPKLKEFVSYQMKLQAEPGDTLIIFTIGHGMPSGHLDNLGQRADVMKALADAAEENNQRVLWWQLSCYASANLPSISSLPETQQELFRILATSNAHEVSLAYVQGRIMEKLFFAMAEKNKTIDSNNDDIIQASELRTFLNNINSGKGDLLYTKSPDDAIFGGGNLANQIPIVDRNGPQRKYPKDYIPLPKK